MKEKWYVATGNESTDLQSKTTKVMFGDGSIHRGGTRWAWPCDIVAYTLGESVC